MTGRRKNEADFKRRLLKGFALFHGGSQATVKTIDPGQAQERGLPDKVFIHKGRHAWIECKANENRKASALQIKQMNELAQAGASAWLIHCNWDNERLALFKAPHLDKVAWVDTLEAVDHALFWNIIFERTSCVVG
jgi:hypothetical protein